MIRLTITFCVVGGESGAEASPCRARRGLWADHAASPRASASAFALVHGVPRRARPPRAGREARASDPRARAPRAARTREDHGRPIARQVGDDPVDLLLGSDVDADRRVVEDDAEPARATASTTFCWLPPDSVADGVLGRGVRIASRAIAPAAPRLVRAPHEPERRVAPSSASVDVLARPSRSRKSALRACGPRARGRCPRRSRRAGRAAVTGRPSTSDLAPRRPASAPKSARASSVRPAPTSPATPRISPARRLERDVLEARLRSTGRGLRATTSSAVGDSAVGKTCAISRPTIIRTSSARRVSARRRCRRSAVAQDRRAVGDLGRSPRGGARCRRSRRPGLRSSRITGRGSRSRASPSERSARRGPGCVPRRRCPGDLDELPLRGT